MDQISALLGHSVQAAMDNKGISKRKLANVTGIPFATLDRKLRGVGKSAFTFPELSAIAEHLDCSVSDLIPEELLT